MLRESIQNINMSSDFGLNLRKMLQAHHLYAPELTLSRNDGLILSPCAVHRYVWEQDGGQLTSVGIFV